MTVWTVILIVLVSWYMICIPNFDNHVLTHISRLRTKLVKLWFYPPAIFLVSPLYQKWFFTIFRPLVCHRQDVDDRASPPNFSVETTPQSFSPLTWLSCHDNTNVADPDGSHRHDRRQRWVKVFLSSPCGTNSGLPETRSPSPSPPS